MSSKVLIDADLLGVAAHICYEARCYPDTTKRLRSALEAPQPEPAEVAALRADAERYRWLRHGDNDEEVLRYQNGVVFDAYLLRNEELDAAIDAAIDAARGKE